MGLQSGKEVFMHKCMKICRKVFFLSPIPTVLISVPSYALVIYALAGENVNPVIAYASYFLSAYALVITITGITGTVRFVRQGMERHLAVRKALGIPLVSRYLREDAFRQVMTAATGQA